MKKYGKWENNMDTACVEMKQPDGTVIAINTLAVEREFVETWLDRRELDYLIYNDPAAYAKLVLDGDVKAYPDTVKQGQ
jgi:hypothetical protein